MGAKKNEADTFQFRPFQDLGKIISNKGVKLSLNPPAANTVKEPDDNELFAKAMSGVREIREFRDIPVHGKRPLPPYRKNFDNETIGTLRGIVSGRVPMFLPHTGEYVEWVDSENRRDVIRRLHKGHYSVQDFLDLHGLTSEEAEAEVEDFMREARKNGLKCIKIIHGRGLRSPDGPVLKRCVVEWLSGRYRDCVRAFVTARQCDGGLGAMYVLLK